MGGQLGVGEWGIGGGLDSEWEVCSSSASKEMANMGYSESRDFYENWPITSIVTCQVVSTPVFCCTVAVTSAFSCAWLLRYSWSVWICETFLNTT